MREEVRRPHVLSSAFATAITALVAYLVAVFVSFLLNTLVDDAVVGLSHGGLWAAELRTPLFFILLLVAVVPLGIPSFLRDLDPALRKLSFFSAAFLIAYVTLHAAGTVDPDIPLNVLVKYVIVPLRHAAGIA